MLRRIPQQFFQNTISVALKLSSLFFFLSSLSNHGYQVKAHIFIYGGCSQSKYQPNSPFESSLNSLLSSIVSSSSQTSYNGFAIGNGSSTPADAAAYGLYQCRGDLKISDCASCIQSAVGQISLVCPYSYAATLQLEGCFLKYENVYFLGRQDTTLMYKKCSRSTSNDVEFFKRRDDVLADLQTAIGFRVGSSGLVEGFAQCLGDLSSADCSSCLAEAIGKLKNICGSASAADVYLGQCYARYWASGYYDSSSGAIHVSLLFSYACFLVYSSNEDQVGKTVAIIVGVLAGLALVVVLLSFLRKAFG
ncbi:hypothetical protein HHK36_027959 [Tetracentron sinense]|uniref:Gnk2-homologous domain-containing protein n=1 Tax=Tetracentron sinense TaxID=13715 RepID=A0A835D4W3_TETSI|nr:hypothetical protein HHK36_027959 [Tetracentron sinense]